MSTYTTNSHIHEDCWIFDFFSIFFSTVLYCALLRGEVFFIITFFNQPTKIKTIRKGQWLFLYCYSVMVHRTEVLNRTLVSNRYFCNHCLNFLKPLKSTETLLIKKNTTITLYTTSCYSSCHHKHTFSDDQATFISWYWVFNWGNSRHICWGTSRGWTSSLSRLNIKSKQLVETKVLSMVKCFSYTHVYWQKNETCRNLTSNWDTNEEMNFKVNCNSRNCRKEARKI